MMMYLRPFWLRLIVLVINWNRIQVLCLKNLAAIETAYVIHAVSFVKEFGSLVLTTWHSEIFLILVSTD
jgi:hypothetical protein